MGRFGRTGKTAKVWHRLVVGQQGYMKQGEYVFPLRGCCPQSKGFRGSGLQVAVLPVGEGVCTRWKGCTLCRLCFPSPIPSPSPLLPPPPHV